MNTEEKRIAIAEACGWRQVKSEFTFKTWVLPDGGYGGIGIDCVPDYFNNHNAIHEAVNELSDDQKCRYVVLLGGCDRTRDFSWNLAFASAAQCAEALGLTLGLWK